MLGFRPIGDLPLGVLQKPEFNSIGAVAVASGYGVATVDYYSAEVTVLAAGSSYAMAVSYVFRGGADMMYADCESRDLAIEEECRVLTIPPKQGCC